MTFPSSVGGATTEQVGYFEIGSSALAEWISRGFENPWKVQRGLIGSFADAAAALEVSSVLTRYLCVPIGNWTLLLSNGPLGTDVGVLPSYAARELRCRALRAVAVDNSGTYPARILEVFGPTGNPPLALERSIVAANDGGRWVFETSGVPYSFEDESAYKLRAKASKFTVDMVYEYLGNLGIPIDTDPNWASALLVERA
ncbi:MAG: hypothetical protein ACSHW9_06010 [Salinibacterium amurskyense]